MAETNDKGVHTCCDDTERHQAAGNAVVRDLNHMKGDKQRPEPPIVGDGGRKGQGGL